MRILVVAGLMLVAGGIPSAAQSSVDAQGQPVLVELFTSEGCSDCPPADALLARLDATQFVPGAHAVVLSEHVTYWNRLGWRDPFSLEAATARQEKYAQTFGLSEVYTPQMVVDGTEQFVGSDSSALARAVNHASAATKPRLEIENSEWKNGVVQFAVRAPASEKGTLIAVLAEDAVHSEVARGENAGRTLHHVAVARVIREFDAGATDKGMLELPLANGSGIENGGGPIRLVVFLVDRRSGHVLTAAEQTLHQIR